MSLFSKKTIFQVLLTLVFTVLLVNINLNTPRTSFSLLMTQFAAAFGIFIYLMKSKPNWKHILVAGVLVRFTLLWGLPELSNDFYRFIWDGELLLRGINPFAHTPNDLISQSAFLGDQYYRELYHGMGNLSASNYSCYPVVNQLFFLIGSLFSNSVTINVIILKVLIVLADIGACLVGVKILKHLNLSESKIGWYFINPFILLEFTGNLHFEGVMIFFILLSIYFTLKDKWFIAAIFLGLAVHVKLIPLLFIPFFFKKLKFRKSLGFTALSALIVLLVGQVLINSHNFDNFMASVQLYFDNFQFNASIFNWVNQIYSDYIGWEDATQLVGPVMARISFCLIVLLGLLKAYHKSNDFIIAILFALVIYYAFATTVHPWYISLILIFSIFTSYNFGILWSGLIMFSYLAYSDPDFTENTLLNTTVYCIVYGYMIYEIIKNWNKNVIGLQLRSFFGMNPLPPKT